MAEHSLKATSGAIAEQGIARGRSTAPTSLQFGAFILNLDGACVSGPYGPVQLRPKSFEVLRCLVEHGGSLVSKEALMATVWPGVPVTDESLTRCISDIRRALLDDGQRLIKTVSKKGYRLNVSVTAAMSGTVTEVARPFAAAAFGSDRPSVAVLPFADLSADRDQGYFADGIADDIITELTRFRELLVIARNSSARYAPESTDLKQVSCELGVRYVVVGSVRRNSDRVRVVVQLIDATTEARCWAERYDRELRDIFAVQAEVARTIVSVLAAHLEKAEIDRLVAKPPTTWQAHDYVMRGLRPFNAFYASYCALELYEARRLFASVLSIDPSYARAHALLAGTHLSAWFHPVDHDYLNPAALERAHDIARRAVELAPDLPVAYEHLGLVLTYQGRHDEAVATFERMQSLNPNFASGRFGMALVRAGDSKRAITAFEEYRLRDPFNHASPAGYLGLAYYMLKEYKQALPPLLDCTSRAPNFRSAHYWLAATYARLGQLGEARREVAQVLRISPTFTIEEQKKLVNFKYAHDAEHFFEGMRKAGLPER